MKVIDLFSGIGGFSLGLERAGMETVAFCEIEPYCQALLKKRWPNVPIFDDVKDFDYDGTAELICGGYPCQPFSVAGKQKGEDDDRHLWPEMFNIIRSYNPRWVIGENVAGHVRMGLDDVLSNLEGEGYTTRAFIIPACAVQAVHRRDRVWIIAHASGKRCSRRGNKQRNQSSGWQGKANKPNHGDGIRSETATCAERIPSDVANTDSKRLQKAWPKFKTTGSERGFIIQQQIKKFTDYFLKEEVPEPLVCRVDDGVSRGVDGLGGRKQRLKGLGNAIVPQIAEIIGTAIMEIDKIYDSQSP